MVKRWSPLSNIYLNIYNELCEERNWEPRKYIVEALNKLYKYLNVYEPRILFLDLPTGYGKTTLTEVLIRALIRYRDELNYSRIIHILPLKSIIHQQASNLKKRYGLKYVGEQHMGIHDSPYLVKKCIITTFDTFMMNAIKLPPPELSKALKYGITHHYFSRAMIYSSLMIFDEAHLLLTIGSNVETRLSIFLSLISNMLSIGATIIVSTASLSKRVRDLIIKRVKREYGGNIIDILSYTYDPSFKDIAYNKLVVRVSKEDIMTILKSDVKKTLIIFNTIRNAVDFYRRLSRELNIRESYKGIILLHGMLPEKVKMRVIECLEHKPDLIIATHSIEAGVDISYERLITLPTHPDSLLQRMGRVARRKHMEGEIIILGGDLDSKYGEYWNGYYDKSIALETLEAISKVAGEIKRLDLEDKIKNMIEPKDAIEINKNVYDLFKMCEAYEVIDVKHITKAIDVINNLVGMPVACYPYSDGKVYRDMKLSIDSEKAIKILDKYKIFINYEGSTEYNQKLFNLIKKYRETQMSSILMGRGYLGIGMPMNYLREHYYPSELDDNLSYLMR